MLSLRKREETGMVMGRLLSQAPSIAVGIVFFTVVLSCQPFGLDQFVLPKALVLLAGAPLILGLLIADRPARWGIRADPILCGVVVAFLAWSVVAPLFHARNRILHGIGALEVVMMGLLFAGSLSARTAGSRAELRLIRLLALPTLIVAPLAVAQGFAVDPLRLIFGLSSNLPGRWQVLTTLGNPTWTAELLVISLPLVLAAWEPDTRWRGLWLAGVGAVFIGAVGMTGSRGALLGLAVAIAGCWRIGLIPRVCRAQMALAGGVLIVLALFVVTGFGRLTELKPLTGRLGLWAAGANLVAQEPLTGFGLRHTELILPDGLEPVVAALDSRRHKWLPTLVVDRLDQDLLQVAAERGLPAALLLVLVWLRSMLVSLRRFRANGSKGDAAVISILAVMAVFSLFSAPFHTPATAALFWVVVGFSAISPETVSLPKNRNQLSQSILAVLAGVGMTIVVVVMVEIPLARTNAAAGLGNRLLTTGRFQEAADVLRPVVYTSPWLTGASIDRSRALIATGGAAEALVILEDVQRWTSSQWIWASRARALDQLGMQNEARREIEAGLRVLPWSPVLLEAWSDITRGRQPDRRDREPKGSRPRIHQ